MPHSQRAGLSYAPTYIYINLQDFHVRDEITINCPVQDLRRPTQRHRASLKCQKRIKFSLDFVNAVDYTPNVHAPINFVTGACQRVGRSQEYYRNFSTRIFDGSQTIIVPRTSHGNLLYRNYNHQLDQWATHVRARVGQLFTFNPHPIYSLDDWLDHSSYSSARKAQIRAQSDIPLDYYRVDTFIKKEAYPEIKAPRLINSRSDAFKKLVGPFTHAIEKDIFSSRFTVKGKNSLEQISMIHERMHGKLSFLCTDYSKWESSITPEVIDKIERILWDQYPSPYTWDFHSWFVNHCKTNNLVARGKMTSKVHGVRMSGDMHTSLGNTFINIMLTDYIMTRLGLTWDGFFEGDDGLIGLDVVISEEQLDAIRTIALELGFTLTMECTSTLREATFLSRHIIDDHTAFREPIKAIVHSQWSFSLHRFPENELLRSRGYGLIMENPHCPILYKLGVEMLKRAGTGKVICDQWFKQYYAIPDVVDSNMSFNNFPTYHDRIQFAQLFNIPIDLQLRIEQSMELGDWVQVNEYLTRLVKLTHPDWVYNYSFVRDYPMSLDHYDYSER